MRNFSFIALGGNLASRFGAPLQTMVVAIRLLAERGVEIRAISRFFETPCFPTGTAPDYVNAAIHVGYSGNAWDLLQLLHEVESDAQRKREQRWGMRTLDLDLLSFGDHILPERATYERWRDLPMDQQVQLAPKDLILPHPRLQDRGFVLVPLADIAPDWRHPVSGQTVSQMLAQLPQEDRDSIKPIG